MSLVHWWKLNSSISDSGTKPKNLTSKNSASFQSIGKTSNSSARYASKAYHYINNDISNCDELSIACWVKLDTTQNGWGQILVISSQTTSWNNIVMGFDNQKDTKVLFTISDGTNYIGYNMPSNNNLQDGAWHHLVGTYKWNGSSTTLRYYVDGIEQSCSPKTVSYKPAFSNAQYITMGNGGGEYMIGNINDARIYDHCLSKVEVKKLSQALVLHYDFEDMYIPLEYIESTGTQFINTGVGFQNGSSFAFEIDCQYPTTTTTTGLGHHRAGISCTSGTLKVGYTQTSENALDWHTAKISWASGNASSSLTQTNYVDGVQVGTYSTQPYDSNPYLLFAMCSWNDSTGLPPYSYEKVRIARCKIYRNDSLIKDFVPVIRTYDYAVGMYEKVEKKFYANVGSGVFKFPSNSNLFEFSMLSEFVSSSNNTLLSNLVDTRTYFDFQIQTFTNSAYITNVLNAGSLTAGNRYGFVINGSSIASNATRLRLKHNGSTRDISIAYISISPGQSYYISFDVLSANPTTTNGIQIKDLIVERIYGTIKEKSGQSGNGSLNNVNKFSFITDTKIGQYALRNVSVDPSAKISTPFKPTIISSGTIAFWYRKSSSAFNYNSGHFLVATQSSAGSYFGATQNGVPFCSSDCSYSTFYLDGVAGANSTVSDTKWHFYCFTGVNLSAWTSFSIHSHGDTSWLYNGDIADFKIFNTSLSADDIKDLYNTKTMIDNEGNIFCEKIVDESYENVFPNNKGVIETYGIFRTDCAKLTGEYEILNYIESTGTQYIDTELKATDVITKIEADIYKTSPANTAGILFGLYGGGNDLFYFDYSESDTTIHRTALGYGAYPLLNMVTKASNKAGRKKICFQKMYDNHWAYTTNNSSFVGKSLATFSTSYNHYLFAYNAQGSAGYYYKCRLYSFKVWVNDVLVRDFIPVKRKSDSVIGLLNKIDGKFFTNKGSGTFGIGSLTPAQSKNRILVGAKNIYEGMGSNLVNTLETTNNSPKWHTIFLGEVKKSFTQFAVTNLALESPVDFISLDYPTRIYVDVDFDYNSVGNTDTTEYFSGIIPTEEFVSEYWWPASIQFTALKRYGVNGVMKPHFDCVRKGDGTPVWPGSVIFYRIEQFY